MLKEKEKNTTMSSHPYHELQWKVYVKIIIIQLLQNNEYKHYYK